MAMMGRASSAASLRYLKASESRGRESPDAIGRRIELTERVLVVAGESRLH